MFSARTFATLALSFVLPAAGGAAVAQDWTVFTPSPDSRVIYVSSSTGNDSNNGLSQQSPKKTLAAGYGLLRDGYPDWLLLKSGDTWNERFASWNKSGRSTNEMMRLGSYGAGERPRLLTGASTGFEASVGSPKANLAITDVYFMADGYNGSNGAPYGITVYGPWSNLLIENCRVEGYFTNVALQGAESARMSNLRVRRNVILDAHKVGPDGHAQGLIIGHTNGGLIEGNLLDHNGWKPSVGAMPTIFRHNVYLNPDNTTGLTVRANIVAQGAASGLRSSGEVCENNLLLANPVNLVVAGDVRVMRNNVTLDSRDLTSNDPRGFGASIRGANNLDFHHNIFAHRFNPGYFNVAAIDIGSNTSGLQVHDNIVYKWNPAGANVGQAVTFADSPSGISIRNNVFQQNSGGRLVWDNSGLASYSLQGNKYFSTNSQPFHKNADQNFSQWVSATGESGSAYTQVSMPNPDRSIATYAQSLGLAGSIEAFMAEARKQSKANWRPQFTAEVINNYIRAGMGVPPVGNTTPPCPADFTGDGLVTAADAVMFMNAFAANDMRADMNGDGLLNILDYIRYQNYLATGCR